MIFIMDNKEILNTIYSFSVNSIAKYIADANPYYKEGQEKLGIEFLNNVIVIHNKIVNICEDFAVNNKVPLSQGSFNHEFAELNYLSFDFLKEYILKELKKEKKYIDEIYINNNISNELKILLQTIKNFYE